MKQSHVMLIVLVVTLIVFIVASLYFLTTFENANRQMMSVLTPDPSPTIAIPPTNPPPPTDTPTPVISPTPAPLYYGSSVYLLDATHNKVLLDANSHQRLSPYSTAKIMTALLAIEKLPTDQEVTVTQGELNEVPDGISTALLVAGDKFFVNDLLYGLMLPSGSDVAVVLAHEVSGDTATFVALMNTTATQLGLSDTHFTDPYGSDDTNQYSTAADLVKLAQVAMGNSLFASIVATPHHHMVADQNHNGYPWDNITDAFLAGYTGANGIKTGSNDATNEWDFVFSAYRNGRLLIGAEMQAPSENQVYKDAENILTKGFSM
jgi:D-alanyl-D-alanine carboxypeptidase